MLFNILYIYILLTYLLIYLNFNIILFIKNNCSLHKVKINKGCF